MSNNRAGSFQIGAWRMAMLLLLSLMWGRRYTSILNLSISLGLAVVTLAFVIASLSNRKNEAGLKRPISLLENIALTVVCIFGLRMMSFVVYYWNHHK